jgi:chromosome segregation ATPase
MTREHVRRALMVLVMLGAVAGLSGPWTTFGAAQSQTPKTDDVLPALLVEVRGLRAAMEQMASAGPRVQLFVSRLQLQEGRINAMVRRLDEVRDRIANAQREADASQEELARLEAASNSPTSPIPREDLAAMIPHAKRELADRKAAIARLAAEEGQLTADITAEQGRWSEINQRLDELERALVKR